MDDERTQVLAAEQPRLSVIVQIHKEITEFKVAGAMLTWRYFNDAPSNLQEAVTELPPALKDLFTKGAPVRDETPEESPWNLTGFL